MRVWVTFTFPKVYQNIYLSSFHSTIPSNKVIWLPTTPPAKKNFIMRTKWCVHRA